MAPELINANPVVYQRKDRQSRVRVTAVEDEYAADPIDQQEIFDHIRDIKDPEHPYTLEELKVVSEEAIDVDDRQSHVRVTFTPTVEHCSMAALIGLSIRVKLIRSLPSRFKIDIQVAPEVMPLNLLLNDKERVAAALENPNLLDLVEDCLSKTYL